MQQMLSFVSRCSSSLIHVYSCIQQLPPHPQRSRHLHGAVNGCQAQHHGALYPTLSLYHCSTGHPEVCSGFVGIQIFVSEKVRYQDLQVFITKYKSPQTCNSLSQIHRLYS